MKFLIVSYIFPQILVVGMVHLVYERVVNLVGLVVCQLMFQFSVDVVVLTYTSITM